MMKNNLIEITEIGEVSVLGVRIGMNRETAKRILTPEHRIDWQVLEGEKKELIVKDYFYDKKLSIYYAIENDVIKDIRISRDVTQDKKERDESLKYYTEKFKSLKIVKKTFQETIFDTGLYNIQLIYSNFVMNIIGQNYSIYVSIKETKYGDFLNKNFNEKDFTEIYYGIGCLLTWVEIVCGAILFFNINTIFDILSSVDRTVVSFIIIFVLFVVSIAYTVVVWKRDHYFDKYKRLREKTDEFVRELKKHSELKYKQLSDEIARLRNEHNKKMNILSIKEHTYENMVKTSLFKRSATMYADYKVLELNAVEAYLRIKKNPIKKGGTTDEVLKKLKQSKKEDVARYKELLYKWEFLMNLFPELSKYVDDDNDIQDLESYDGIDDFKENYDRARDYLTEEEYRNLSEDERNQRALDIWKGKRKPSKWIAGVEYEMCCAYLLRKKGFYVIEHGIQKGLNDLGIDLIARQQDVTYIIQCKRYSNAEVHENTICQLFGTTLKYKIDRQDLFDTKIIPLLLTTGELTDTAKEFADKLGVKVVQIQMGEYPMIKCNINNGNKIYHLPFDQQYWRTIIEPEKGEFYAMTVKQATQAGFRRAFKYKFLGNK